MMVEWLHYFGLTESASAHGGQLDSMLGWVHWLMLVLFVGWGGFFLYTLFRFRARRNPKADYAGVKSHFSSYLEVAVAVIEAVLLIGFAIPIWATAKTSPPNPETTAQVHIIAQQFAWNVHYPGADGIFGKRDVSMVNETSNPIGLDCADPHAWDDVVTINQLHLPVGKMALLQLSSKDVIHSFFLPLMRVKQDIIPGMAIPVWFTPIKGGKSEIACSQLCGLGHYRMRGFLNILESDEYTVWRAGQATFCQHEEEPAPEAAAVPHAE